MKMNHKHSQCINYSVLATVITLLTLALTGCGGGGGGGTAPVVTTPTGFNISGKIAGSDGTPVSGAVVQLSKTSYTISSKLVSGVVYYGTKNESGVESVKIDGIVQTKSTNSQGEFVFQGIPGGTYTVQPEASTAPQNVLTITSDGTVYKYNPDATDWTGNKLSADQSIIYNSSVPFTITDNTLGGLNFEATSGGVTFNW